ncbi:MULTISPECIES: hypothetical protein [unclassified Pseudodesulfovibrio]|uniref:hypothetical protein n=1 Tax=unclassified Pseudodesulfovibrio TaxID=2661612 RepID=UPI000FEBB5D6|nr:MULTISPECIES: hypothetical protein [unclassified Pseudodesulfovibrio]MCJ2164081.1 hypothetical protein [Pseudodesulfovibrio sp. S3-i]
MLEVSTIYLLLAMFAFVLVAVLVLHHHNSADLIQRKQNEVRNLTSQLTAKSDIFEQQIIDLRIRIDEIDEQIEILEERGQQ